MVQGEENTEYRLIFSDELDQLVTLTGKISGIRNHERVRKLLVILETIEMRMTHEVEERI